jgi:hypothetical protein
MNRSTPHQLLFSAIHRTVSRAKQPRPAGFPAEHLGWIDADPHELVLTDGRFVHDNEYWLNEGDGTTFQLRSAGTSVTIHGAP